MEEVEKKIDKPVGEEKRREKKKKKGSARECWKNLKSKKEKQEKEDYR